MRTGLGGMKLRRKSNGLEARLQIGVEGGGGLNVESRRFLFNKGSHARKERVLPGFEIAQQVG
jgi:hypothetical protein